MKKMRTLAIVILLSLFSIGIIGCETVNEKVAPIAENDEEMHLEAEEEICSFLPIRKNDCEGMIRDAETLISATSDFVKQLRLFTEKQNDLENIRAVGYQKIILLK